jgi:nucleoside-triphosphatase THEP1
MTEEYHGLLHRTHEIRHEKTRKVIRRERCCIMGTAYVKVRTSDARIANECENIQHGNENVLVQHETQQK